AELALSLHGWQGVHSSGEANTPDVAGRIGPKRRGKNTSSANDALYDAIRESPSIPWEPAQIRRFLKTKKLACKVVDDLSLDARFRIENEGGIRKVYARVDG